MTGDHTGDPHMAVEAVTFDFWNTLMSEEVGHLRGRRLDAWAGLLEDAGFATERQQLEAAFDVTWQRFVDSWTANQQFQAAEAAEHALEALGFDVPPEVRVELVDAFAHAGRDSEMFLADGIEDCLQTLKDAGIRIGIICDVGFTPSTVLREHLIKQEILPLFDHWSFSDEVGAFKPSPVIFEHALAGLGDPVPARVAHVGDIRRTDIAGALGMGMVAVRYTGISDDQTQPEPEGHHVINHHAELAGVLGIT
jgi:putative hydrolase of the HAD superfamily